MSDKNKQSVYNGEKTDEEIEVKTSGKMLPAQQDTVLHMWIN